MSPAAGPLRGGTPVTVFGSRLGNGRGGGDAPACRFGVGAGASSSGTYDSESGTLLCTTPSAVSGGDVTVAVALNGDDFTHGAIGSVNYSFTDDSIRALTPNGTSEGGGTLVEVGGHGLLGGGLYLCSFGAAGTVPAYVDAADGRVFCLAPPWPPAAAVPDGYLDDGIDYDPYEGGGAVADAGNYSRRLSTAVELSTTGVDFTASGLNFTYHPPPRLTDLEPTVGPSAGDTDVVIHGDFGDAPAWVVPRRRRAAGGGELVDAPTRGAGARAPPAAHRARGERVGRPAGDACQSQLRGARGGGLPEPQGRLEAEV